MEKRLLVAFALSFAIIVLYTKFVMPPPKRAPAPAHVETRPQAATPTPLPVKAAAGGEGVRKVFAEPGPRNLSTVGTGTMEVTFTDRGGCMEKVVLKRSQIIKKGPITIVRPLSPAVQPVTVSAEGPVSIEEGARYRMESDGSAGGPVTFVKDFGPLRVRKIYRIAPEGFVIGTEVEIENRGREKISFRKSVEIGGGGIFALSSSGRNRYVGVDWMDEKGKVTRLGTRHLKSARAVLNPTRWVSMRNQFFAIVVKPEKQAAGYNAGLVEDEKGEVGVTGGLEMGGMALAPGEKKVFRMDIYVGPKEFRALTAFGTPQVIDLGWFGFLGKWILKGLNALYALCGNYGVAIILLTVIIRAIIFPLNQKSFRSMKAMQELQPKVAELQAKFKDDPKRKQQEMMKIYREHGVNPMGGCLPMLLQMPILIAFFRVLQNSIELWGAPFMLWIKDLSEPDALFRIPMGNTSIPIIGGMITRNIGGQVFLLINVLPLLMLAVFFIQQKMSTTTMATTPEQAQQQKMMSYMMPIMFGVIFYNMPAGLNLYFTASTLLGIIQQKYMIR